MKKVGKHSAKSRNPRQLRAYDFDDTISPEKVREIFSGRGQVGAVRIISGLTETVVCFKLLQTCLDDDSLEPVRWKGKEICIEDGWE